MTDFCQFIWWRTHSSWIIYFYILHVMVLYPPSTLRRFFSIFYFITKSEWKNTYFELIHLSSLLYVFLYHWCYSYILVKYSMTVWISCFGLLPYQRFHETNHKELIMIKGPIIISKPTHKKWSEPKQLIHVVFAVRM